MAFRNVAARRRRNAMKGESIPIGVSGIGPRVLKQSDGGILIPGSTLAWMDADAQRRAMTMAVPDFPLHYMSGLPDGVADPQTVGYRQVGWQTLRRWREQVPIICAIHASRARTAEFHSRVWDGRRDSVGFRVRHPKHYQPGKVVPAHMEKFITQAEGFLREPCAGSRKYSTLRGVVPPLIEDLLTINRMAIEVLTSSADPNKVVGFRPIDAGLIMERVEFIASWLTGHADDEKHAKEVRRYLDMPDSSEAATYVSEVVKHNLPGQEYVLVRSGIVEGTYSPGRIMVESLQRRTDVNWAPYQPSCVEDALEAIAASWEVWNNETNQFREGFWADTMLLFSGGVNPADYQQVIQTMREGGQGYKRRGKPIPIRGLNPDSDVKVVKLKDPPTEMGWSKWFSLLAGMIAAVYSEDLSSINLASFGGRDSGGIFQRDRSEEIDNSRTAGHKVDLGACASLFTRFIRAHVHPQIEVDMEFGEYDAMEEARLHEVLVKTTSTRNELRIERGQEPWGFHLPAADYRTASDEDKTKHDQNPWNMPDSQTFMQQAQALAAGTQSGDAGQNDDGVPDLGAPGTGMMKTTTTKAEAKTTPPKPVKPPQPMAKGWGPALPIDDWQTYG